LELTKPLLGLDVQMVPHKPFAGLHPLPMHLSAILPLLLRPRQIGTRWSL
jgi:hypothetical protein